MTRKDYVMVADAIKDAGNAQDLVDGREARIALETAATFIADGLSQDNPRFDRKRFMAACGFHA